MEDNSRDFAIETVISITSGKRMVNEENIYELLGYLFADSFSFNHMYSAILLARLHLCNLYPELIGVRPLEGEDINEFLNLARRNMGEYLAITPINDEEKVVRR